MTHNGETISNLMNLVETVTNRRTNHMMAWETVDLVNDETAWEIAKEKLNVTDVRKLSTEQFIGLIALAQNIKDGTVNVDSR